MNKGLFLCGLFIALFLAACGDDEVKIANQMTLYSRPDTIHLGGLRDGFHIGEGLHGL